MDNWLLFLTKVQLILSDIKSAENDCTMLEKEFNDSLQEVDCSIHIEKIKQLMKEIEERESKWIRQMAELPNTFQENASRRFMQLSILHSAIQSFHQRYKDLINRQEKVYEEKANYYDSIVTNATSLQLNEVSPIRKMYQDILQQNESILKLEHSLIELKQLFMDFQLLVNLQQPALDDIELNLQETNEVVQVGTIELKKAIKWQTKARYKQWYILGCIIIILIVLIIIIVLPIVK